MRLTDLNSDFATVLRNDNVAFVNSQEIRNTAFEKFKNIGFPSPKDENWLYTNLKPVIKTEYDFAYGIKDNIEELNISEYGFTNSYLVVFFNGKFCSELSKIENISGNVSVENFPEIDDSKPIDEVNPFVLLNTMFASGGYSINIAANSIIDKPVHILNIFTAENPVQFHQLYQITVSANSQVEIIEEIIFIGDQDKFINSVFNFDIAKNARLDYTSIQNNQKNISILNHGTVRQQNDSKFSAKYFTSGGKLVRNEIKIQIDGENCQTNLNGINLLSDMAHIENYTNVEHNQPNSTSEQLFKYILNDDSSGVFNGLVKVDNDAQKTDSQQSNKNIILSKNAQMNSNPQLEINADAVKCSHGSATGELDEDILYYLQSRGIDLKTAKSLLIEGFAKEVIDKVKIVAVKEKMNTELQKWLEKS